MVGDIAEHPLAKDLRPLINPADDIPVHIDFLSADLDIQRRLVRYNPWTDVLQRIYPTFALQGGAYKPCTCCFSIGADTQDIECEVALLPLCDKHTGEWRGVWVQIVHHT